MDKANKTEVELSTMRMPYPKYFGNRAVQIHTDTLQKQVHQVYLNFEVVTPNAYSEFLDLMNTATEIDEIHVHINCEGGDGFTTMQVLNTMANCNGYIVTYAEGMVASAATMILLAGHEIRISGSVCFMVHAPSSWIGGKHPDLISQVDFMKKYWKDKYYEIYGRGFMTKQEIKDALSGKDFWMDANELSDRLNKRQERDRKEFEKQGIDLSGLMGR